MRPLTIVALVLIVLGVISLAYQGITYSRSRTVLDIGPIEARVEERRTIPLPPILGGAAIVGGIILLLVGSRASRSA
jgi:hypothetical protein